MSGELLKRIEEQSVNLGILEYISVLVYSLIVDMEKHSRLNNGKVLSEDIFDLYTIMAETTQEFHNHLLPE